MSNNKIIVSEADSNKVLVKDLYMEILGRSVDPDGLNVYTELLNNGNITVDYLRDLLLNSNEYKEKNKRFNRGDSTINP